MSSSIVHRAVVKSVVSGDTLIVKTQTNGEQRISLNHINAPKLARTANDVDEPFAFQCRENLRKKLIGREIFYTIDFQVPQSHRLMCSVYLGENPETSENLVESLIADGLVELRRQTGARANDPKYQRLLHVSQKAKKNPVDRPEFNVRDLKWTLTDPNEFVERQKSAEPIDAIVEFVRDGNTVRCLLLPTFHFATIQLTGIRCPMIKRDGNNVTIEQDEPFAQEAKDFVESRLLQRDVKIVLSGVKNQNLLGTILHPNGNISLFLLREGLAKCVDWTVALLPPAWREKYRQAEKFARDNRLRVWQNFTARTIDQTDELKSNEQNFHGKVLQIVNADALIVRDLRNDQIQKIFFASVRTPRAADFQSSENGSTSAQISVKRPLYDIPFVWDGHEFLRKRLIGKTVRIETDFIQKATGEYPEKIFSTVYLGNVNIGEALISRGLAKAQRYRPGDEQRSSRYDALLSAEQQATKRSLGLFSKDSGLRRMIDLTGESNKERAKGVFTVLKHHGPMDGIVEFVASASRFRIHILRDNYILSFLLSSIQCPRPERRVSAAAAAAAAENSTTEKIEPAEPFGTEALNFSKEHFLQRDVIVEVENVDRAGNFIGRLTTADGQSVALMLVQAALAKIQDSSAHKAPNYKQLLDAQENCKRQRIGVWTDYEEPSTIEQESEVEEQSNGTNNEPEILDFNSPSFRRVMFTHISSDFKVYLQYSNQGQRVEQLQSDLRQSFAQTKPVGDHTPKKNELLAAQFSADNEWYRARVEKIEQNNHVSVYFIDYGNREVITNPSRLTALPSGFTQLPGQAHEYEFAYVRIPPDSDDREQARNTLFNTIGNDECLMRVEYRQNNIEYISLFHVTTKENLVKSLAEQGLIIIAQGRRQSRTKLLLKELDDAQQAAKAARRGLWQYSDQIEDDATEFGFTGRK